MHVHHNHEHSGLGPGRFIVYVLNVDIENYIHQVFLVKKKDVLIVDLL